MQEIGGGYWMVNPKFKRKVAEKEVEYTYGLHLYKKTRTMNNYFLQLLAELKNQIILEVLTQLRNETNRSARKEYYSLKEVSEITGLTINSIKGRYRRGTLRVVYSNNRPLIPASELERFLNRLGGQYRNAA